MATPGPSTVPLLARVRVAAGVGIVRFVGQTAFAGGKWIGIELDDEGTGKNDGSVQGKPYFALKKAGTLSGVFVRPSQVHIIDAHPQDEHEEDEQLHDNADVSQDISQDEIQNETIPEDDEVFAVPQPPKNQLVSRPPSATSSSARSSLISPPPPTTPSANRRLSARPASRVASTSSSALVSPSASPRPSLARPLSGTPAARLPAGAGRPTPTSRISSTSSVTSATSVSRRESTTLTSSTSRTPGRPILPSRAASQHVPATPRPSAVTNAPLGTARKTATPRNAEPQAAEMTRGISSSSSHSSLASASRLARPLSRPASKADVEPPIRTLKSPITIDDADASPGGMTSDGSPQNQQQVQRGTKQSVEESRFSLQPAASGGALDTIKQPLTVPARLYEELQLKFKLLESGRSEDRERLKEMEKLKEDAESWNLARPKLQNKMIELSNEVKELRRQIKDDEAERISNAKKLEDLTDQLEMEMLDKEVAEEKYEDLQTQLESAKEKVAELEVELEVLRKEEARIVTEAGEGLEAESGDVKSSLAFIQLAKQNERLKEALVRLRDMSTENEQDYKKRIADLEKELDLTSDLQSAFDTTLEQLEQAEGMVENLKIQLDDAMGAEDMLEHLTERNLTLSERIEEMHAVIQDLEALKELNDELEENHVENEKHMQEEIDLKDHQIREYQKQMDNLEDSMLDYEGTISQFRELVINLQSDLEQLREQQQVQQSEKASLSSQSQAMLNLNMKLQSTVVRNQSKTVDFELRKFEALQARQQLQMVIPYLPAMFQEDDKSAIDAFLFFSRLVCKAQILIHTLDQTHGLQDGAFPDTIPEGLVIACETRWRLARFMILCKRFAANLQRCDPKIFVRMGKVYVEMLSMEKRLDVFINFSKKQELKEADCGDEIDRFMAQAAHVAELHIGESGLDLGEQHLGQTTSIDYDLDTFIAGVGYAKQALALAINDPDVVFESGDLDVDETVFARLQGLVDSARAVKATTKKLVRRLEEVADSSASLRPEVAEGFQPASVSVRSVATFANKLATLTARYTLEVRTSKDPFVLSTFFGIIQEAAADIRSESKDLLGVEVILHNLKQKLAPAIVAAMEPENVVKVTYEEPWVVRANDMHRNAARDEEAEQKVVKLTEDIRDLARELRLKDQHIQEAAVKIELLQKRMESGKRQADSAAELDAEVAKLKEQEREFEQTISQLQKELDTLERENSKLKQAVPAEKNSNALDIGEYTTFTGSLETSHLVEQIESLRGTVRYLRHQNSHLKSQGLFKDFYRLPTYETAVSDDQRETRSRAFAEESNALLKQVASLSSRARVIDVSKADTGKAWQPLARQPSAQLAAKRHTLEKLKTRIDRLAEDKKELSGRTSLPKVVRL